MIIKDRVRCSYDLVVPTSIGVRITPENRQGVNCSSVYTMQATSAETNVATISSSLGLRVKALTKFVKDSSIAQFIKRDLRARNIQFDDVSVEQGGPWGYRHQFNIADSGFGPKGPRVQNDRAGEVGITLCEEDFDLEKLFSKDGVRMVHMSGLIAALSPKTAGLCLTIAETAKEYGTLVSFDLNYRESFWKGRKQELYEVFHRIAGLSDVLIGNEEDFQLCLGIRGPETGGKDISDKVEGFGLMSEEVKRTYPKVSFIATTLREVLSANEHLWGALLFGKDGSNIIMPRKIEVLDRIGGGDGYVGGLLYSLLQGKSMEECNNFGWACGALAAGSLTDYAIPADEKQIEDIYKGNARVKR